MIAGTLDQEMTVLSAYDELPYKSMPIEWTAPERLALVSLLHGGPRLRLSEYRVLELGCADGANLLPMAFFRPDAQFFGIDSAESQIAIANSRKAFLRIENVDFICKDFRGADQYLSGSFDIIIAHGVFSWVDEDARRRLLDLCSRRLRPSGLFYVNYNTYPGWKVRGLVRKALLSRSPFDVCLSERALFAQKIAAQFATSLASAAEAHQHPFIQLLAREFRFVTEHHHSYVAHEYLAANNQAYWRSDFLRMAREHGLDYIADADFNYPFAQRSLGLALPSTQEALVDVEGAGDDMADLLSYRQLHSPILGVAPAITHLPTIDEFSDLTIASCLSASVTDNEDENVFSHPSGYTVHVEDKAIRAAFLRLLPLWPTGIRIADLFANPLNVMEDLKLLQRNGLVEMRCAESRDLRVSADLLNQVEAPNGYVTTAYHTRMAVPLSARSNLP